MAPKQDALEPRRVDHEGLRAWLLDRLAEAAAIRERKEVRGEHTGRAVTLRSLSVRIRPKDPAFLREWADGHRQTPPTVSEFQDIVWALREAGVELRLVTALEYLGADPNVLAAEIEGIAPFSDPNAGARLVGKLRDLTPRELDEVDDFIKFIEFQAQQREDAEARRTDPTTESAKSQPPTGDEAQ